jgi:hypothetical protein
MPEIYAIINNRDEDEEDEEPDEQRDLDYAYEYMLFRYRHWLSMDPPPEKMRDKVIEKRKVAMEKRLYEQNKNRGEH